MAVTALEIHTRSPVLDGRAFGRAGAYEKLAGMHPLRRRSRALAVHAPIADLALAPRNARGRVEIWADFYLLRPVDPAAGNRRLLLDVPNRGRKVALGMFNSAVRVPDPTRGRGLRQRLSHAPWLYRGLGGLAARRAAPGRHDGASTSRGRRGVSRSRSRALRVPAERAGRRAAARRPLSHPASAAADLDDPDARADGPRARRGAGGGIRRGARGASPAGRASGRPGSPATCTSTAGFEPGKIYDCYYRAEDPPVVGLGFLAVRDSGRLPALRRRGAGQPVRGRARSRLRLRRVAERALPPPSALPRARRGRAGPARVRRRDPARGRRRGAGSSTCASASPRSTPQSAVGSLFPFADAAADRSGHRPARRPARSRLARARRGRRSSPSTPRPSTGAATPRSIHTDVAAARDVEPPPRRPRLPASPARSTRPARCRRRTTDPNTGSRGRHGSTWSTTRRSCGRRW